MTARTVKIKVRWPDFNTITRQKTLSKPTNDGEIITSNVLQLFEIVWQTGKAVRLLGVGVSGFENPVQQIGLWDVDWEKEHRLQNTLTKLREKFGDAVLSRGLPEKTQK